MNDLMENAIRNIAQNHRQILDDFCKAYMAQLYEEGKELKPGCYTLFEQQPSIYNGELVRKYWFEPGIPDFPKTTESEMGEWHDIDIVQMMNDMKGLKKDIAEIKGLLQDRDKIKKDEERLLT